MSFECKVLGWRKKIFFAAAWRKKYSLLVESSVLEVVVAAPVAAVAAAVAAAFGRLFRAPFFSIDSKNYSVLNPKVSPIEYSIRNETQSFLRQSVSVLLPSKGHSLPTRDTKI